MSVDMWISDRSGEIGLFNTATGALVAGTLHHTGESLTDIAFIGDDMYGTTFKGLYAIDDNTGSSTLIGDYTFTDKMNALVGDGSDLLAASYTSDETYRIDPATRKVYDYADVGYASAGDLAFAGSSVYESVVKDGAVDGLYDVTAHKLIGTFETNSGTAVHDVFGLADGGSGMYAVAGTDIYSVNLSNAHLTLLSSDAASGIGKASGAAFVNESAHGI